MPEKAGGKHRKRGYISFIETEGVLASNQKTYLEKGSESDAVLVLSNLADI